MRLRTALIIGGASTTDQRIQLDSRPHVIIATPGRLASFLRSEAGSHGDESIGTVLSQLCRIRALVLDEADQLLINEFASDLHLIMGSVRRRKNSSSNSSSAQIAHDVQHHQTILVSATMSGVIQMLRSEGWLKAAAVFDCTHSSDRLSEIDSLEHKYLVVPQRVKEVYLCHVLVNDLLLRKSL